MNVRTDIAIYSYCGGCSDHSGLSNLMTILVVVWKNFAFKFLGRQGIFYSLHKRYMHRLSNFLLLLYQPLGM